MRCAFRLPILGVVVLGCLQAGSAPAQQWSFAVSGDSRNCGDFVMPAIAAKAKAEKDAFYWHLGDFRWMSAMDEDIKAMQPPGASLSHAEYQQMAWDDFLTHQIQPFGKMPVFLGRGNHENVKPMTRASYVEKFAALLDRPEIRAQRAADGDYAAPPGPWYHWTQKGVDFITLDNADHVEFTDAQLMWLRAVLDRDLAPHSGIRALVLGMHEALPHSTGSSHAMDDWARGMQTGEQVYTWLRDAQTAGKHVYIVASHSHYYSPNVFNTQYWKEHGGVAPGWIIGAAGAHRYALPADADAASKTHVYGYMRGTVHRDGSIDFQLQELSENDLIRARWPNAPLDAIHECYIHNGD